LRLLPAAASARARHRGRARGRAARARADRRVDDPGAPVDRASATWPGALAGGAGGPGGAGPNAAAGAAAVSALAPELSVLLPAFNEAESLPVVWAELGPVLDGLARPAEVIFVDDGSAD